MKLQLTLMSGDLKRSVTFNREVREAWGLLTHIDLGLNSGLERALEKENISPILPVDNRVLELGNIELVINLKTLYLSPELFDRLVEWLPDNGWKKWKKA